MPVIGVPNRLLLIVAKRTLLFFLVILLSYGFVTLIMDYLFATSSMPAAGSSFLPPDGSSSSILTSNLNQNSPQHSFSRGRGGVANADERGQRRISKNDDDGRSEKDGKFDENSPVEKTIDENALRKSRKWDKFDNANKRRRPIGVNKIDNGVIGGSSNERRREQKGRSNNNNNGANHHKKRLKSEENQMVTQFLDLIGQAPGEEWINSSANVTRYLGNRVVDGAIADPVTQIGNDLLEEQRLRKRLNKTLLSFTHTNSSEINGLTELCPEPSPFLRGRMKQVTLLMPSLRESEIISANPDLKAGGSWRPSHCRARYKVAVILPFRDRQSHLNRLLDFLIPVLKRQLLDFRFIVTEQYGHDLFNKGRIMNAAFEVSESLGVDCVVFHDVDMFPQDDRNAYGCPNEPRHIGAFVNTLGYELWYNYIVGGALAIQMEHYKQINGYSNMFWAWGGEDDDMGYRILANNFTIERPDPEIGRMTMLKHIKRSRTAPTLIRELLKTSQTRWVTDGLNDTKWKVIKFIRKPLYYHLYVNVGVVPNEWREDKNKSKNKRR